MKKILLFSNIGWILVAIMIMGKSNIAPIIPPPTPGISCSDCRADNCTGLPTVDFLKGIARYKRYQWNSANAAIRGDFPSDPAFQDARSCWYSIDTLKKFICLIEKKFPGVDPSTSELGIRFYYATYPDTAHYKMVEKLTNNPGKISTLSVDVNVGMHHTLFMVPTMHNEDKDIDLFQSMDSKTVTERWKKEKLNQLMHPDWSNYIKHNTKLLVLGGVLATDPSSKNQGMLCPPTCPTDPLNVLSKADAQYPAITNK